MGGTINWGIFKRHFWGELLRHQHLAKKLGVSLRQSYARVGKLALIKHQRYAHAHQFKRANRSLRKLKTYLGRVIRERAAHCRE